MAESRSGAATAIIAVVALLAIVAIVWLVFLRGGPDAGGPDVDVDINVDDAVESVTPE
ncbi:hypothetical protein [Rubrivirga sp. IMCC45206]|uniref:hypothetical protein n=1 Tax=Rubrivirga sp. IMCC45206 TaxID=3391614 RepID=UPI00398FD5CD